MSGAFLIGFRGVGKTTLGRRFAKEFGWKFIDLDEEWERLHQQTILNFVEKNGLPAFRLEEERLLRSLAPSLHENCLIATGGGIVEWDPSLRLLAENPWPKVWLELEEEGLWQRLAQLPDRRKIGGLNTPEALAALLAQRRPLYEKIATCRLLNRDITQALIELKQLLGV